VCLDPTVKDSYVGSTTNLIRRKCSHKQSCENPNNKKYSFPVYTFIREHGGFENWQFVVVRRYKNIKTKEQLLKKERKYMERLQATLNKQVPTRTYQEYYENYKPVILERVKKYQDANKQQIKVKKQVNYQLNKDAILEKQLEYRKNNKEIIRQRDKQYREKKIEIKRLKDREYRIKNREQLKAKQLQKIECECGCMVARSGLSKHKITDKHKHLMEDK
jgi:hypothetical protein